MCGINGEACLPAPEFTVIVVLWVKDAYRSTGVSIFGQYCIL